MTPEGVLPPTGRHVRSRSAAFYRVDDGLIVEFIGVADNLEYFSNFGRLQLVLDTEGD